MKKLIHILPEQFHSPWMNVKQIPFKANYIAWPIDGVWRGFVRWLHATVLDELYIPKGTKARIVEDNNRVPARQGHKDIKISSSAPSRRGVQEEWFFEQFGYTK